MVNRVDLFCLQEDASKKLHCLHQHPHVLYMHMLLHAIVLLLKHIPLFAHAALPIPDLRNECLLQVRGPGMWRLADEMEC